MKKTLVICGVLLAIALAVGVFFWRRDSAAGGTGIVLDANQAQWDSPYTVPAGEDGIRIPGYGTIYFPAGQRQVQLTLYNPEENDCYFAFSLYLEGEEIYASDYVEPGNAIENLELTRALTAGEYTLYINIQTYDPETESQKNGASVQAELIVV
ncbi:MAG TPA: hypothetical protein IAB92_01715 [Candidatus Faecousia faecigallinarum]|nr:hypothetical protein [Candidatus Faecousia faecigallinarum]